MSRNMKFLLIIASVLIVAMSFGSGYALSTFTRITSGQGLGLVEQAWTVLFDNYVEPDKLDATTLSRAAIKGIVEELDDPYTYYLAPEVARLGMSNLEGKFDGIGATVAVKDEKITIVAPIPGSPAAEAGIKPGDVILEIDGQSTAGMTLTEAVLLIRGLKGTPVTILVKHEDQDETEEIEIIRDEIKLASVNFEMKGDIAHLIITHFSVRTDKELAQALHSIGEQGATGIILDLRSNPGGLLESVVDVASYFLSDGVVVKVRDNEENITVRNVRGGREVTDLPIVVLVDEHSASGSEVLAGALRDRSRATIAGSTTFGKGSVNIVQPLGDGSSMSITVARWLTPDGHLIEGEGLPPDYELDLENQGAIEWAIEFLKSRN
ncbi:S41 family peptidase [Chloroflexota bacterium]